MLCKKRAPEPVLYPRKPRALELSDAGAMFMKRRAPDPEQCHFRTTPQPWPQEQLPPGQPPPGQPPPRTWNSLGSLPLNKPAHYNNTACERHIY